MDEKNILYLDTVGLGDLVVFCGAGISKNSGLPLANELGKSILEKFSIDKKDIDEIMNSNLPFEAFIESLSEDTDISNIINMYKDGEPNTNHILIARLANNGSLRTIFTTNFDLLIERALEKEGLKEGVDFTRYYNEEHFSKMDFDSLGDKVTLFKIHGTADDKNSIRTTLKAVASKILSDKRMNVIRYLFSKGRHKKVLILGYSCSDEFDITPQIQSIRENKKEIIFVEHCIEEKEEVEDIKIKDYKNPFKKFPGKRIRCNTDKFIKDLWDSLRKTVGTYNLIELKIEWKTYLDDWVKELVREEGGLKKYFITGLIFQNISDFKKAGKYYEKSLEIATEIGNKVRKSNCYGALGCVYDRLGDFTKAIEYHEKSLEIAKTTGDKVQESRCYTNLGITFGRLGDFKKGIEYYEKSLAIDKDAGDKAGEAASYMNLGVAYDDLGDFKKAIEYYEKSLEINKEIGNKAVESKCYANLGTAYRSLGDFTKAIEYHEKSLEIAKTIGDKVQESLCYTNLGVAYNCLGDIKKAIEYYEKSLEINKEIGDKAVESANYMNLGVAYNDLGDFKKAVEYHGKSLEMNKEIGDKAGESICCTNLGIAQHNLGNFRKAIENYLKAEEIFKETGQIHYLKGVYENLSHAYKKLRDNENAKKYKKKLEEI